MVELEIETYFNEFLVNQDKAYENFSVSLEDRISFFQAYFDFQQKLFLNHYPGPRHYFDPAETIILQSYWKSTHLIFSVNQLILRGDYGSARVLMRQIFEYLLMGKYMYTIKDNTISEQWLHGKQFNVYDKIIKLLKTPDKKNFHDLWILLSKLVHAGSGSLQIGIANKIDDDILFTYNVNLILLACKNYLLQRNFITNNLVYISERYGKHKDENIKIRKQIRHLQGELKNHLTIEGFGIIKDFKQDWELKK